MYIFGVDIPLVEVFIGISIMMAVIFLLMIYTLIKLSILNRKINKITKEEEEELKQFKKIRKDVEETRKHEAEEVGALHRLKMDIERLIKGERAVPKAKKKKKK